MESDKKDAKPVLNYMEIRPSANHGFTVQQSYSHPPTRRSAAPMNDYADMRGNTFVFASVDDLFAHLTKTLRQHCKDCKGEK